MAASTAEQILHQTHSEWQQAVCKKDVNALWIVFTEMAEAYLLKRAAGMTIQQDKSYKGRGKLSSKHPWPEFLRNTAVTVPCPHGVARS